MSISRLRILRDDQMSNHINSNIPPAQIDQIHEQTYVQTPVQEIDVELPNIENFSKVIKFGDNTSMRISNEWYNKYEKLREPIIFRNGPMFRNVIYPLLTGEQISHYRFEDEYYVLEQLINEIEYYGIQLTPFQINSISRSFIDMINIVRLYIIKREETCCSSQKKYKMKLIKFNNSWSRYIQIKKEYYPNDNYNKFTADSIMEMITSKEYFTIINLNVQKHNIIFDFVNWFDKTIIKNHQFAFDDYINSLSLNKITNSTQWLESKLLNLPIDSSIKNRISSIVNNANIINESINKIYH